ncbi:MAG: hypothetical protein KC458_10510 [Dehalococcoidia bacterium]|nr:hypothetical protein [Dehalococcoidia bacterium]MCB9483818.1 hypothetical protein [Dehalococcoidia bacterium]MCB9491763.1 hypothetical protein [Dehalococcoidia bacterium]
MAKSVALGFGAAGAVVAAAVVAVVGSTVGLGASSDTTTETSTVLASGFAPVDSSLGSVTETNTLPSGAISSQVVTNPAGEQIEYVYVDEPAPTRHGDDDDDRYEHEDREHEAREHGYEHEDDD